MKKKLAWLLLLILFWSAIMFQAYASEEERIEESAQELMGQMDTDEINRMMEEIFPGRKVSFEVLIKEIFSGDIS